MNDDPSRLICVLGFPVCCVRANSKQLSYVAVSAVVKLLSLIQIGRAVITYSLISFAFLI